MAAPLQRGPAPFEPGVPDAARVQSDIGARLRRALAGNAGSRRSAEEHEQPRSTERTSNDPMGADFPIKTGPKKCGRSSKRGVLLAIYCRQFLAIDKTNARRTLTPCPSAPFPFTQNGIVIHRVASDSLGPLIVGAPTKSCPRNRARAEHCAFDIPRARSVSGGIA